MPPDAWPDDPVWNLALVRAMVREIDTRGRNQSEIVLANMLASAWPSLRAQDQ